mgnify:CR=1 FL=1
MLCNWLVWRIIIGIHFFLLLFKLVKNQKTWIHFLNQINISFSELLESFRRWSNYFPLFKKWTAVIRLYLCIIHHFLFVYVLLIYIEDLPFIMFTLFNYFTIWTSPHFIMNIFKLMSHLRWAWVILNIELLVLIIKHPMLYRLFIFLI